MWRREDIYAPWCCCGVIECASSIGTLTRIISRNADVVGEPLTGEYPKCRSMAVSTLSCAVRSGRGMSNCATKRTRGHREDTSICCPSVMHCGGSSIAPAIRNVDGSVGTLRRNRDSQRGIRSQWSLVAATSRLLEQ